MAGFKCGSHRKQIGSAEMSVGHEIIMKLKTSADNRNRKWRSYYSSPAPLRNPWKNKLPPSAVKKLYAHLEDLKRDPHRPLPKADFVPMAGSESLYRLRVGKLRIEYEFAGDVIK